MPAPFKCRSLRGGAIGAALAASLTIGGCREIGERQPNQNNVSTPAARAHGEGNRLNGAVGSREVRELRRLYAQLQEFKDDGEFQRVEFGRCCQYFRWRRQVDEISNRSGPALLRDLGFALADLIQLASTYARTRGRANALTRHLEGRIRNGLDPAMPSSGTGVLRTAGRWCTNIEVFEDFVRGMESSDMELMSRAETDPSCREYPIGTRASAVLAQKPFRFSDGREAPRFVQVTDPSGQLIWVSANEVNF